MTTFPLRENSGSAAIVKVGLLCEENVVWKEGFSIAEVVRLLSLLRMPQRSVGGFKGWTASVYKTKSRKSAGRIMCNLSSRQMGDSTWF